MMDWDGQWGSHMDGAWGWFGGAMMIVWMLLLIAAIVAIVAWIVRGRPEQRDGQSTIQSPRDIVDTRFARGEIDEAQRDKMLKSLS